MLECKSISAARLRHQRVKDHRRDLRGTRLSSGRAVKEGERRHMTALLTTQKSGVRLGTMRPFQILVKGLLKTRSRVFFVRNEVGRYRYEDNIVVDGTR